MLFTTPPLSCSLLFLAASLVRRRRTSLLRPLQATSPHSDRELLVARAERTLSQRIRFGEEATRSGSNNDEKQNDKDADSDVAADTAVSSLPLEIRDTLRDLRQSIDRRVGVADALTPASAPPNIPEVNVNQGYGKNPTITTTALAHLLWQQVLRPGLDSAIDATAGNGGDSVVMANLLFPSKASDNEDKEISPIYSELVAVDIQPEACRNTQQALESILSPHQLDNHVQTVCGSHAPLPMPHNRSSIALVAYNLGYLPKTCKTIATQTASTLQSLTDAVLCLRVGGLLSIVTYPRSNPQEDWAVHVFVEGLALFTSDTHDWRDFVQTVARLNVDEDDETVRTQVQAALERVWEDQQQQSDSKSRPTWRVHQHKKLGWIDAPILLTAVRIK